MTSIRALREFRHPKMWRLAAFSRFPRNARVQHIPTNYGADKPKCGTNGQFVRIHFSYAEKLELRKCDGCFYGISLHDNTKGKWREG